MGKRKVAFNITIPVYASQAQALYRTLIVNVAQTIAEQATRELEKTDGTIGWGEKYDMIFNWVVNNRREAIVREIKWTFDTLIEKATSKVVGDNQWVVEQLADEVRDLLNEEKVIQEISYEGLDLVSQAIKAYHTAQTRLANKQKRLAAESPPKKDTTSELADVIERANALGYVLVLKSDIVYY